MADRVGAIYVEVFADTTAMKRQIERGGRQSGAKAGREAGNLFGQEFQEQLERILKQVRILPGLKAEIKRVGGVVAKEITSGLDKTKVTITPELDMSAARRAITALGDDTGAIQLGSFIPSREAISRVSDAFQNGIGDGVFRGIEAGVDRFTRGRSDALAAAFGAAAGRSVTPESPGVQSRADELGPTRKIIVAEETILRIREKEAQAIRDTIGQKERELEITKENEKQLKEGQAAEEDILKATRKRYRLQSQIKKLKKEEAAAATRQAAQENELRRLQERRHRSEKQALKDSQSRVEKLGAVFKRLELAQGDALTSSIKASSGALDSIMEEDKRVFAKSIRDKQKILQRIIPSKRFEAELNLKPIIDASGLKVPEAPRWDLTPEISNEQLRKSAKKVEKFFRTEGRGAAFSDMFSLKPIIRFNEALDYTDEALDKIFKGDRVAKNLVRQEIFDNDALAQTSGRLDKILVKALKIREAQEGKAGIMSTQGVDLVRRFQGAIRNLEVDADGLTEALKNSGSSMSDMFDDLTPSLKEFGQRLKQAETDFEDMTKAADKFGKLKPFERIAIFKAERKLKSLRKAFEDVGATMLKLKKEEAEGRGQTAILPDTPAVNAALARVSAFWAKFNKDQEQGQNESISGWEKFAAKIKGIRNRMARLTPVTMFASTKEGFTELDAEGNRVGQPKPKLGVAAPDQKDTDAWWKRWSANLFKSIKKIPFKIPDGGVAPPGPWQPEFPAAGGGRRGGGGGRRGGGGGGFFSDNEDDERRNDRRRRREGKNILRDNNAIQKSLRRFGGRRGVIGGSTSALAGLFGIASLAGKLASGIVSGLGKGITFVGDLIAGFAEKIGKVGGIIAQVGGSIGELGSTFGKAAGPIGMAVQAIAALGIIAAIASGITMLSPLVFNIAGIFTLFAGALVSTVAAGVLLIPIMVSVGAGLGVMAFAAKDAAGSLGALFKASLSGDPKQWDEYRKSLEKLTPAAEKTVTAFEPLLKGLKGLQTRASEAFFAGMAENVEKLAPLMSMLDGVIISIATSMGNVVDKFLALGENAQFMENLQAIFDAISPIIDNIGQAFVDIMAGLVNFFGLLSPLAIQMSEAIAGIAAKFLEWTSSDESRASIMTFFQNAYIIAGQVMGIIGTLGQIMMAVFTATQEPLKGNEGFLQRIQEKLDGWLLWVNTHSGTIKKWLDEAATFAGNLYDFIKKVVDKFVEWNTPENQAKLQNTVDILGDMVGFAMDVADALSATWDWLRKIGGWLMPDWLSKAMSIGFGNLQKAINFVGGDAEGAIVWGPSTRLVGEQGPEAIIPLTRPLAMINPSVRPMAAALRGQGQAGGPQKVINLTQNITPRQSDPMAVATSVVNSAVALARL